MEKEAINEKKTMRTALKSITKRLLQDAVEIINNEKLNNRKNWAIENFEPSSTGKTRFD